MQVFSNRVWSVGRISVLCTDVLMGCAAHKMKLPSVRLWASGAASLRRPRQPSLPANLGREEEIPATVRRCCIQPSSFLFFLLLFCLTLRKVAGRGIGANCTIYSMWCQEILGVPKVPTSGRPEVGGQLSGHCRPQLSQL